MSTMSGDGWRHRVETAVAALRRGELVVVLDDEDRENEGDLIMAADAATEADIAFMVRHTSGLLCVAMDAGRLAELRIPLMVPVPDDSGGDRQGTAFTVSVDRVSGTTTGISAADRAGTARALADPASVPGDFHRPGHMFPLRARPGGVLERAGHTEAGVDLATLAGRPPAAVLAEIVAEDGSMARGPYLRTFAGRHGLALTTVDDLIRYRRSREPVVSLTATARLPTMHGEFHARVYRSAADDREHVALVLGTVDDGDDVLVRMHSECLTGDAFGSLRCDCGPQLRRALERIAGAGRGVLVYLGGHEGRGIGLTRKLRAYELQDAGLDTVEANLAQGLPADGRDYAVGARILGELGISRVRLMTNNPGKSRALVEHGVSVVGREPLVAGVNDDNVGYLHTKRRKLGHLIGPGQVGRAPAS